MSNIVVYRDYPGVSMFYTIITLYAVYLSFKRNNGFDLISFIIAVLFAPIYIIFHIATTGSLN